MRFLVAGLAAVTHFMSTPPGEARPWKPEPNALAGDYLVIQHQYDVNNLVQVIWLDPLQFPSNAPGIEIIRDLMKDYVIVGTSHVEISLNGSLVDKTREEFVVKDDTGLAMNELSSAELPDTFRSLYEQVTTSFTSTLGQLGKTIHWRIFAAGDVSVCDGRGLRVAYADEVYTFKPPIPGCED